MDTSSVVVIERVLGDVSARDLQTLTSKMVARWEPAVQIRLLVDLTEANLSDISFEELLEYIRYAERIGFHSRAARVAIVAERDTNHTLAKLYQTMVKHEHAELAVFTRIAQALLWIREPTRMSEHD